YRPYNMFYEGRPLHEVAADLSNSLVFARKTRNQIATDILLGLDLAVHNLRGGSPGEFRGKDIDEATFLAACDPNKSTMALCFYPVLKAEVSYLAGDPAAVLAASSQAEALLPLIMGNVANAHHALYRGLGLAARAEGASAEERAKAREELVTLLGRWEKWAAS